MKTVQQQKDFGNFIDITCLSMMESLRVNCEKSYNDIKHSYDINNKKKENYLNELYKIKKSLEISAQNAIKDRQKYQIKNDNKYDKRNSVGILGFDIQQSINTVKKTGTKLITNTLQ